MEANPREPRTYEAESIDHLIELHERMRPLSSEYEQRAVAALVGDVRPTLVVWVTPATDPERLHARLRRADRVTLYRSVRQSELVAETDDGELVQVLLRSEFVPEHFDDLIGQQSIDVIVKGIQLVDEETVAFDVGGVIAYALGESAVFEDEEMLPSWIATIGEGDMCDLRSAWLGSVSVCQRVDRPEQVVDLSQRVFKGALPPFVPPTPVVVYTSEMPDAPKWHPPEEPPPGPRRRRAAWRDERSPRSKRKRRKRLH